MFKKNIRFSFIWELICWFLFYLNSAWRRIAAYIKVKVKHARRLQGIVMSLCKGPYTPGRISACVILCCVHTQAIFADDEPSEHANSFPDIRRLM